MRDFSLSNQAEPTQWLQCMAMQIKSLHFVIVLVSPLVCCMYLLPIFLLINPILTRQFFMFADYL